MFPIDLQGRKGVYNQIVDNMKLFIEQGIWEPEEELLSVGDFAKALVVNPNTVKAAYFDLEHQGYLRSEEGQRWFVTSTISPNLGQFIASGERTYLQIDKLTKRFDDVGALDNLDMRIKKGSIYGLVGVNGSGKTTLIKHLAGLYRPDSGQIRLNGILSIYAENVQPFIAGYIPEETAFPPQHDLKTLHKFFRNKHKQTWNDERYQKLLRLFDLDETQLVRNFSPGMQKQAAFLLAISAMPDVLLLDAAIDAFDPITRRYVLQEIIEDVADRQMTVLMTSHNGKEIESICDMVGIIDKGRIIAQRNLEEWKSNLHKLHVLFPPEAFKKHYPYDGLDVLHMEECGNVDVLLVRGQKSEIAAHINKFHPLLYDHFPITLEELFAYERAGDQFD